MAMSLSVPSRRAVRRVCGVIPATSSSRSPRDSRSMAYACRRASSRVSRTSSRCAADEPSDEKIEEIKAARRGRTSRSRLTSRRPSASGPPSRSGPEPAGRSRAAAGTRPSRSASRRSFELLEGIGPVEQSGPAEHEEVLFVRAADAKRGHLQVRARRRVLRHPQDAARARPRQHRAADRAHGGRRRFGQGLAARRGGRRAAPDPAALGDPMHGKTCAAPAWHEGRQAARLLPLLTSSTTRSMREYGSQAVVWQTATNPSSPWNCLSRRAGGHRQYHPRLPRLAQPAWSSTPALGDPGG